jgi:ABC-type polysaccharide/polyol phosphate export permease
MSLVKNAIYLAWSDTKARYKTSVIGPFWPTLSNVLGVLCLGLVWGHLLKQDMDTFIPQLTVGLIVWQLIAGVLTDGPSTFTRHGGMIRNVAMPSWFFAVRALSKHLINLLHNVIIIVGVMWYYQVPLTANTWLLVPGLLLVTLNLYWLLHGLGLAGARFRDIELLINSLVPLLFFISPVIYRADSLPAALNVVWLNPFSYMIEAVRTPILGGAPPILTWTVLVVMLLVGGSLTWVYQRTQGKNLAFWV